jgi:hypothetical protein
MDDLIKAVDAAEEASKKCLETVERTKSVVEYLNGFGRIAAGR